eukprot:1183673-Prorocentrum_minimum.AAC.3
MWPRCGPDVAQMWSRCGPDVVQIWSRCGPDVVQMWSRCGPDVAQMWSRCGPDVEMWSTTGSIRQNIGKASSSREATPQLLVRAVGS